MIITKLNKIFMQDCVFNKKKHECASLLRLIGSAFVKV